MSSSTAASSSALKTSNTTSQSSSSPAYSQAGPANPSDSGSQRRAGGSGSFGAGSSSRHYPTARNSQPLRKQHKAQRRARLADEDAIAESAAMKSINSRKGQTSITHLMNFSLPPRPYFQQQHNYHPHNHRHQRRNPTWGIGSGYHAIDKARYVHANYRFIVRPDREYHTQAVDADVHLEWDAVLQVLASAETQSASCPICLSTPIAPRMAKCGHIFCLPCLIRYMHSTDDTNPFPEKRARWKKCPICEDSIYISEVRPVRWFIGQEASMLREGGDVLLKLLAREPGSTLALPRDAMDNFGTQQDIPWCHVAEVMDYARFMKGGENYMRAQYDDEITHLQNLEKEDELMFGEETTWTQKAVASISEAKNRLVGIGNPPASAKHSVERKTLRPSVMLQSSSEDVPDMYTHYHATKSGQSLSSNNASTQSPLQGSEDSSPSTNDTGKLAEAVADMHVNNATTTNLREQHSSPKIPLPSHPPGHTFYFYHALPNFFLSPLDIRILKSAFANFSSFPSTLLPRVEHISTGHIVDDELRKRAKYMAHLPYGCEVNFLECDWTDVISPTVLAAFSNEIGRRRKKNHEKDMREEREKVRAEKEEDDKRWAAARRKRPSAIEKSFSESDFQPLTPHDATNIESSLGDTSAMSITPPWSAAPRTHSSFATLATPGTSPDAPRTVWGTAAVAPISPPFEPLPHESQPVDDGWLQNWERDLLDNNDAVAMVEASLAGEGGSKVASVPGSGRKKKNKKITLMSTNARRGA